SKDARPLGLDAPAGLGMVGARNKLLFPHAYLKRKRPLAGLRQQVIRLEATADLGGQAETIEPAGGKHDRVEAPFAALPQTCIDVPAERLDRQLGLQRQQLGLSPHGRCADAHPRSKLRSASKRVASILSFEVGAYGEVGVVGRGLVVGRMDG